MRRLPFGVCLLSFLVPAVQAGELRPQPAALVALQGLLPLSGATEPALFLDAFARDEADADTGFGHWVVEILPFIDEAGLYSAFSVEITDVAVLLNGHVTRARDAALLRTPLAIAVDRTTSEATVVFGPIPAGKLMGQSFTFSGPVAIRIVCLRR